MEVRIKNEAISVTGQSNNSKLIGNTFPKTSSASDTIINIFTHVPWVNTRTEKLGKALLIKQSAEILCLFDFFKV